MRRGRGSLTLSESLYELLTWMRRPSVTPFFKAARMLCWAKAMPDSLAMIDFLMAAGEEPVRSLRPLIALMHISR